MATTGHIYAALFVLSIVLLLGIASLRRRQGAVLVAGWPRLYLGLGAFAAAGLLLWLASMPGLMSLFVPGVAGWLAIIGTLLLLIGVATTLWGTAAVIGTSRAIQQQKTDDDEWRNLYLNLQELSQQPFSFVEMLNLALNQMLKRAEADGAVVMLYKENTDELILAAFSNLPPDTAKRLERINVGGDVFGRVQKLARVQNVVNIAEADLNTMQLFEGSGFLSVAVFPIRSRERVLGSMGLFSARPFHFTQKRQTAILIAANFLAHQLESVRNEKEMAKLRDRLKPSEEAKRITEELFFRRGVGGNLELREAVEFERVRKFFDADCIKLVFRGDDGEFRVRASSGGAETGLLLDRRKLTGLNRAISERKLLLLTSPKSSTAGGGFDSMPRQTLFIPVPYPERDDIVLLLESEAADLQFTEEKLSAVRVASVYLADLHFLFLSKRDGDRFRASIRQVDDALGRLLMAGTPEALVGEAGEIVSRLLPDVSGHLLAFRGAEADEPLLENRGLSPISGIGHSTFTSALSQLAREILKVGESIFPRNAEELTQLLPAHLQGAFRSSISGRQGLPSVTLLPLRGEGQQPGACVLFSFAAEPPSPETLKLVHRLLEIAAVRLQVIMQALPRSSQALQGRQVGADDDNSATLRGNVSQPVNGSELLDFLMWNRIDTNFDRTVPMELGGVNVAEVTESLVRDVFAGRAGRLFLSQFGDETHHYVQITTNELLMRRFREGVLPRDDWRLCAAADDLPAAFRSIAGEYATAQHQGQLEAVTWRVARQPVSKTRPRRLHILGIDDQEVIRELLSNIITRMGHRITTVADGIAALEMFRTQHFDIVIAEAELPDLSGWEIAQRVKSEAPQTPVIILSGWEGKSPAAEGAADGADFVLTKPFKMEQLSSVISHACRTLATS